MSGVLEVLVRIRDQLDALIVGLVDMEARQEEPEKQEPVVESGCKHKHTQTVGGMGGSRERIVCVDCKEEI